MIWDFNMMQRKVEHEIEVTDAVRADDIYNVIHEQWHSFDEPVKLYNIFQRKYLNYACALGDFGGSYLAEAFRRKTIKYKSN